MQKEFYYDNNPQCDLWDYIWTTRTIEQELACCEMESTCKELLLSCLHKEGKILDAGCGFGKWVIYFSRLGYNIMGIDNNKIAISKVKEFDNTIQIELGDILNIDYPDNTFDAYISSGVVEHFEDGPMNALNEAYRVLKPSGLIFVSVPTVNIMRKIISRPVRNAINAFPGSLRILREWWGKSKFTAIYGAIGNIVPQKIRYILRLKWARYYHFMEYRYSKSELENFLRRAGFEVVETVPHDLLGSKEHAAGLWMDFPFLRAPDGVNFHLNSVGKLVLNSLNKLSPWIACSSVLCVGRSLKN